MNHAAVERIVGRYQRKDRLALSRLLTWAADMETSSLVRAALDHESTPVHHAPVIAFTGSGGVGKSTLIGRILEHLRSQDKSVAVLACDPVSSLTGGALLGDRVRMNCRAHDPGVFIRSVATSAGRQAIAENIGLMTELLARFGFDIVLLETAGAGQGDTAVRDAADVVLLLVQPEVGDELQWEKAGVLEIADLVVVNKADLPGPERTEAQLRTTLNIPGYPAKPVLRTSGGRNEGVPELWAAVEEILAKR